MMRPPAPAETADAGASAVEYALLLAGVAMAIIAIVFTLGIGTTDLYSDTCAAVEAGRGETSATC